MPQRSIAITYRRRAVGFILGSLALTACTGDPAPRDATVADDAPAVIDATIDAPHTVTLAVDRVEDLGALSQPSTTVVGRDGASSGGRGNRVVWTFGDTFLSQQTPDDHTNVRSATAGWSTVEAPFALSEPVDDAGIPEQLIPYTASELAQNTADALNGWALWPGAVIDTGAADLLVLFQRIKRTRGSGFDGVGVGTARLAIGSTRATDRAPTDLFSRDLPDASTTPGSTPLYGSAGVSVFEGYAYFFACDRIAPLDGGCGVARAPVAMADQRAAFTFYDGSGWNADPARARAVIQLVGGGLSVTFNPYLGRFVAVNSIGLSNDVILRTASRIEGPWPIGGVIIHPSDTGVMAPPPGNGTIYLALEHIELRAPDARSIVISYSRPTAPFRGEVRLARVYLR